MILHKDMSIPMRDGLALRANLFLPEGEGPFPVLMCLGIYGKDAHFEDAYKPQYADLIDRHPEVLDGSSGAFLRWEIPDPERWTAYGYALVVVDGRGSGRSPGYLDPFSPVETHDYYECIEWAGTQAWSTGRVGLLGISYLAMTQWQVAGLRPPHLAALCPWEGGNDLYRDWSHHGGVFSNQFPSAWMPRQVAPNQHGNAETHHRDRETGARTTGPEDFHPELLRANRADHAEDLLRHPLDDAWYAERSARLERIEAPLLSAGNWGGTALHLRGNIEGYLGVSSQYKWLFIHIGAHYESFYLPAYLEVQRQFFDCFLKLEDNGWTRRKPVQLEVRSVDGATPREESEWPLARTRWTRFYLDPGRRTLGPEAPATASQIAYAGLSEGVDFSTPPFSQAVEFTGPVCARLRVAADSADMDIFATLRLFDEQDREVIFAGASEKTPLSRGWLRASHRKLDPERSTPYRPWLAHDERQPLAPNTPVMVDVEIWPTSIVVPEGHRLVLTLAGKDFEFPGLPGRMLHNDERDRPAALFGSTHIIYTTPEDPSYLLMPLIPEAEG
jgi:predicted acyl esterase